MTGIRKQCRILVLLAVLCVLSVLLPTVARADGGGSFTLFVTTRQNTVIEPTQISYTAGQTVADALEASEYSFVFSDSTRQYIISINGESGNFVRFHDYVVDGNDYDLSVAAEKISFLVFTETEAQNCDAFKALVRRMGEYNTATNNVQNYHDAKKAYETALNEMRTADAAKSAALLENLNLAISAYEAILGGTKQTVTFSVTQNGKTAVGTEITMTDAYNNVSTAVGTSISVVAGQYDFEVSDGGYNCVRGTVTVESGKNASVTATLPYGKWFGDVELSRKYGDNYDSGIYRRDSSGDNEATYYVPDCTTLLYLYAEQGTDIPDTKTTLHSTYVKTDAAAASENRQGWHANSTGIWYCLTTGMTGRDITLEARYTDSSTETNPNGYTQVQSFAVHLVRVPTLASLTAAAPDGTKQILSPEFDPFTDSCSITSVFDSLTLSALGYGDGYKITGTGAVDTSKNTTATVTVTAGGQSTSYTLNITHSDAAVVAVDIPTGCTVEIFDAAGNLVTCGADGKYRLVPEDTYTYVTTKNIYYHATAEFTAKNGITVNPSVPDTADAVSNVKFYTANSTAARKEFASTPAFSSSVHALTYSVTDSVTILYSQVTPANGYTVTARYIDITYGNAKEVKIENTVSDTGKATSLVRLVAGGGESGTLTLRASKTPGTVTYYQDYVMTLARKVRLKENTLKLTVDGEEQTFTDANTDANDENIVKFTADNTEYYIRAVANTAKSVTLTAEFNGSEGYSAEIRGSTYTDLSSGIDIALDPDKSSEDIEITVRHSDPLAIATTYTVHILKSEPVEITFSVTPKDATVFLTNNLTGRYAYPDADGKITLPPGAKYSYNITKVGYVGQQNTSYTVPKSSETVTVTLAAAPERTYTEQEEVWPSFRADKYNNGVTGAKTPTSADNAVLYWATQLGAGYSADACGCPILVGDYLYTYAKDGIYKLNTVTGQVVASGKMDHQSSFAINSPTYAEGMIFVGLADGCVQAFDADTLESLWLYTDSRGGQPNCPIVYNNGYIYTGFWQGESLTASFVCLSVTDEDTASTRENKIATWQYASLGGFYWAGAYVTDDYVIIPTDDGAAGYTTGYASLLSLDARTGALISALKLPHPGDARCSAVYCNNRVYFTTKGGYFYSAAVSGKGELSDLRYIKLDNYANKSSSPPMSTCSPVIYNGRAYIGVSGTGQFTAYSGHNITVIDLDKWNIAYTVRTQGYPQTSGLLTTAYSGDDGTVYVYFIDNYTPGKVRVLRDKAGQTEPDITVRESAVVNGQTVTYDTAQVLFTPGGSQAQYAICSPIADEYGTMYFKNDSAYMMALGSKIEKLRIDSQPDKTVYSPGETFDPTGMKVTAVYSNGLERDVTDYVTYSTEALTSSDSSFLISFPYVMYQNKSDGSAGSEESMLAPPTADVKLTIGSTPEAQAVAEILDWILKPNNHIGDDSTGVDVNDDGKVDVGDIQAYYNSQRSSTS